MAINSVPHAGRAACQQAGFCCQGCTFGAKWSTLYTEIPHAEATGKAEVRPESQVLRIEHDASGKVTGVVYADRTGALQRQKARVVALAGEFDRKPAPAAQFLIEPISAGPREFFRAGRPQLHAARERHRFRESSKSPCTSIAAPRSPRS